MSRFNRRRFTRKRLRLPVEVGTDARQFSGYTSDISWGDVGIQVNRVFRPGTRVTVRLKVDDLTLTAQGEVRRARQAPGQTALQSRSGMGIEFTAVSDGLREYLQKMNLLD